MNSMTLSAVNKRRAKEEKARRKLQRDFTAYKKFVFRDYIDSKHLRVLDQLLMEVSTYATTEGRAGIGRIIIEMPPRHGKSVTVSRLFPTWHLGNHPTHRVMMVGYGASLSEKHSRYARNLIRSPEYQAVFSQVDANGAVYHQIRLAEDSQAVQEWDLQETEGGASALGIGGAATGKGANILIIDDPIKNRAEAESETIREKIWDSYTDDLLTRLEPGGAVIIIHTRWHTDDLIGRLLANEPEDWHRLRLPALAEDHDILDREPGEALWPERFTRAHLENIRDKRGQYTWASLYQQNPIPSTAGIFDTAKIEIIDGIPDGLSPVRFYDLAVTAKKHSDYTAGAKMAVDRQENVYILHMYRQQKTPTQVQADIIQNAKMDSRDVHIRLEAEKAGIIQLDFLLAEPELRGYTLDAKPPEGDKFTRAQPFAARVNAGKVKMLRGLWNRALIDELAVFPMGAHDDQVDALSGAYDMLSTPVAIPWGQMHVKGRP